MNKPEAYALLRECQTVIAEADTIIRREPDAGVPMQRLKQKIRALREKLEAELKPEPVTGGGVTLAIAEVLDDLTTRGLMDRLEGIEVTTDAERGTVKLSLRPGVQRIIDPPPAPVETTPYNPHSRPPETMEELAAVVGIKLPERP